MCNFNSMSNMDSLQYVRVWELKHATKINRQRKIFSPQEKNILICLII